MNNRLSEYIMVAFTASLIAGIGERMAPIGMRKYVTFIASLIVLLYLFIPLKTMGEELFSFADNLSETKPSTPSENSNEKILTICQKKTEEAIQKHLCEKFNMTNSAVISLDLEMTDNETILITHILVELTNNENSSKDEIEAYLEKTFHTEVTIIQNK